MLRVLQGIVGSAGQPAALARGLRQYGVAAKSVIIGGNRFSYDVDETIDFSLADWVSIGRYLANIVDDFDVFHLHMRPFFYWNANEFYFPSLLDLLILKAAGKRVCFHFRGSEVRKQSLFRAANRFHYVDDDPEKMFQKFREPSQNAYIRYISAIADKVFVTDPELQGYVPGSVIIPRYFQPSTAIEGRPLREGSPVVLHAPSRRGVKGTQFVLAAVEQLRREGLKFEFRIIEGRSNEEALAAIADADILVDQLRIGWYGVLAVEGLALGRAVISYIRPDLIGSFGEKPAPVANANPETITDVLRECITKRETREAFAHAGQDWFRQTHSTEAVIPLLMQHYGEVMRSPKPVDARIVQQMLEEQASLKDRLGWLSQFNPGLATALAKFQYIRETDGTRAAMQIVLRRLWRGLSQ